MPVVPAIVQRALYVPGDPREQALSFELCEQRTALVFARLRGKSVSIARFDISNIHHRLPICN